MTLIIIQGQGYYLACPKCSTIITPPQGSPIPDPARLQGKVCPACEDARELAQGLTAAHTRAEALVNALPPVDWDSDAQTCAELDAAHGQRRKLAPKPCKTFLTTEQKSS